MKKPLTFLVLLLFTTIFCLESCNNKTEKNTDTKKISSEEENVEKLDTIVDDISTVKVNHDFDFLDDVSFKKVPFTDSTNFDNFTIKKTLTKEQMKLLKLDKNIRKGQFANVKEFILNYRLNLFPNIKTLVLSYYLGENELYTILVNYDENYEPIDFKQIAYDEIAEGCLKTIAKIYPTKLDITEINYCSDELITKTNSYSIEKNGKIRILKN